MYAIKQRGWRARCPCLVGPVFGLRWRKCTWAINEMGGRATSRGDSVRFTISGSPSRRSGLGMGSFLRKVFTLPQYMYCYSQGTRSPTPNPDLGGGPLTRFVVISSGRFSRRSHSMGDDGTTAKEGTKEPGNEGNDERAQSGAIGH